MKQAKQLVDGYDVEVWQRARKIARFEHKPKELERRLEQLICDLEEQLR
jgi:hypothetical protein